MVGFEVVVFSGFGSVPLVLRGVGLGMGRLGRHGVRFATTSTFMESPVSVLMTSIRSVLGIVP